MKLWMSKDGKDGHGIRYCMENARGLMVEISTLGAAITQVVMPDKNGVRKNVCLSLADAKAYHGNGLYAGATVAPVAGRIGGGKFKIGNKEYQATINSGGHCLHGGENSASFCEWKLLQVAEHDTYATVAMLLHLPDGLDGFPGNRTFMACYTLDEQSRLQVSYKAVSDQDTYVNMTNHSYFNLSGDFGSSAMNQIMTVAADAYFELDECYLPGERVEVKGTCMDFSRGRRLQDVLEHGKERGIDHAFDVRRTAKTGKRVAELFSLTSGCGVRIKSPTAQCVVVYTGGFMDGSWVVENQGETTKAGKFCAVALECQAFPNAINRPDLKPEILKTGETYRHEIVYEFLF
ncbi:MAG: galactose mutarotase [Lachnospiraceae bacterium]|nr:galactose mutarotase [Lachnospiraceae bacterium]